MAEHKFKAFETTGGQHYARCTCGHPTGYFDTRQEVEDEQIKHHQNVERIRAHLSARTPSLKGQRDYYLAMAESHLQTDSDRALWRQLADELTARLGESHAGEDEQLPLV